MYKFKVEVFKNGQTFTGTYCGLGDTELEAYYRTYGLIEEIIHSPFILTPI